MANQSWFSIFSSVQNICPGTRDSRKNSKETVCVYICTRDVVFHVFSRREDLSGSNRTCSEIPSTVWPLKMRRRYKNWPPAFSDMQWPSPYPLYASAWSGQHATFTKEFLGNFLPRFKRGQLKISSSREMDVFIISCCFILSISCCHSVPTSLSCI